MRTLLVTGPGGQGRTTVAAAAALSAARAGSRTLLLTADPVDAAGGALGTPTGSHVVTPAPGLSVLRPDPAAGFRAGLLALQRRAGSALDLLGAVPLDGDELTPLPGSTDLALLRGLRDAAAGRYDLVVVDLPATPAALVALALPEQLRRYLRRLLPQERRAASALRPVLGRLAGVPVPTGGLYEAAARWDVELAAVQSVIEDPATGVWLVAEPGAAGAEAVRTATAGLALYGLRLDALLANRLLPENTTDPWLAALAAQQRKTLDDWSATLTGHSGPGAAENGDGRAAVGTGPAADTAGGRQASGDDQASGGRVASDGGGAFRGREASGAGAASRTSGLATGGGGCAGGSPAGDRSSAPEPQPAPYAAGLPRTALYRIPHLGREPRGIGDLDELSDLAGLGGRGDLGGSVGSGAPGEPGPPGERRGTAASVGRAAAAAGRVAWPVTDHRAVDGVLVWHLPLPGVRRDELDLIRRGDELIVSAGAFRRIVDLPSALRRCTVAGARLADGELRIRFRPDPALWPRGR